MTLHFSNRTLQRKFDLLVLLTHKEFALKYKRTFLGIVWSLLNPLLTAIVFFIAFKIFMRFEMENYTYFLLTALFPWSWFSASVIISARSLVDNVTLIKKMIFPRHYLVASVLLAQMAHFVFAIPILFLLSFLNDAPPSLVWIYGIPIACAVQFVFTYGLALIISMANTFFRDIEYLVGVLINLTFWMTPIIYPMTAIPEKYRNFALLNPMTSLMNVWRSIFLHNDFAWRDMFIAGAMAVLILTLGLAVFRKYERRLDEVL